MILQDFHIHTKYSTDSTADPWEMAETAIEKGLRAICFTDHQDIGFDDIGTFTFDPVPRFQELSEIRKRFAGRLKVSIGVELGLLSHDAKIVSEIKAFAKEYPWDYIIGSTHMLPRMDGGYGIFDPVEEPACFSTYGTRAIFDTYYRFILDNIRTFDCFDTLGHLDYLCRYVPENAEKYAFSNHLPLLEEILKTIIAKNKNLEINTKGLYSRLGRTNPEEAILDRYFALGGKRIVFGSDAHVPAHVAGGFDAPFLEKYQG